MWRNEDTRSLATLLKRRRMTQVQKTDVCGCGCGWVVPRPVNHVVAIAVVVVVGSAGESEISLSETTSSPVATVLLLRPIPRPSRPHPPYIHPNCNHSTLRLHILHSSLPQTPNSLVYPPTEHNSTMSSSSVYRRKLWLAPPEG